MDAAVTVSGNSVEATQHAINTEGRTVWARPLSGSTSYAVRESRTAIGGKHETSDPWHANVPLLQRPPQGPRHAVAHAMGTHLDLFQRIVIGTCSVSAVAYSAHGPVVLTVNSTGSSLADLRPS